MFNDQKTIYRYEDKFCRKAYPFLRFIGVDNKRLRYNNHFVLSRDPKPPHTWMLGWKHHKEKRKAGARYNTSVKFGGHAIVDGAPVEGEPVVFELDPTEGWSRVLDAQGGAIVEQVDEEIQLRRRSHMEYTADARFSVVNKSSVKAEGGFGDIASASASVETEITAETSFGTRQGWEEDRFVAFKISSKLEAGEGEKVLYVVEKFRRKVVTPITDKGYLDFDIEFDLWDWAEDGKHGFLRDSVDQKRNRIKCAGINDLIALMEGDREHEYPRMNRFLDKAQDEAESWWAAKGTLEFYDWLRNKENRKVNLQAQRVQYQENASTIRRQPLS